MGGDVASTAFQNPVSQATSVKQSFFGHQLWGPPEQLLLMYILATGKNNTDESDTRSGYITGGVVAGTPLR